MADLQHKRTQLRQARKEHAHKVENLRKSSREASEMKASLKRRALCSYEEAITDLQLYRLQHGYEEADQAQQSVTTERVANLRYLENKSKEYMATLATLKVIYSR